MISGSRRHGRAPGRRTGEHHRRGRNRAVHPQYVQVVLRLDKTGAARVLAQFQSAVRQADAQILEAAADRPDLSGMGTTVTMAFQLGVQLCIVHVGDSRVYLDRDGELHQPTDDHMLGRTWCAAGPFGKTRSLGISSSTSSRTSLAARSLASRSKPAVRSAGGRSLAPLFGRFDGDGDQPGDRGHTRRRTLARGRRDQAPRAGQ